jgi:hypothetical protein
MIAIDDIGLNYWRQGKVGALRYSGNDENQKEYTKRARLNE